MHKAKSKLYHIGMTGYFCISYNLNMPNTPPVRKKGYYRIFENVFEEFSFYIKKERVRHSYLTNNYLLEWARSVTQYINRGKLMLIKKHQECIFEIEYILVKSIKSVKFLEKVAKYMDSPFDKSVLKKLKRKIKVVKSFKEWLRFMQTFRSKIEEL